MAFLGAVLFIYLLFLFLMKILKSLKDPKVNVSQIKNHSDNTKDKWKVLAFEKLLLFLLFFQHNKN